MLTFFYSHIASGIAFFLLFLAMATQTGAEESEDIYLKSGAGDIPIYSKDITPNPVLIQRRNDFFLKAGKSVPRIGRRNYEYVDPSYKREYDEESPDIDPHRINRRNDFFFKAHHKQIPRIGRRNEITSTHWKPTGNGESQEFETRLLKKDDDATLQMDQENLLAAWPWFRDSEMLSPYQKRKYNQHYLNVAANPSEVK